jgi:basic membrane protein A
MKTVHGMKKCLVGLLVCLVVLAVSCSKKETVGDASSADKPLRVALLINGTLGDKSFHDSANNGLKLVSEGLGVQTRVVEATYDESKWEPALLDLCDENYDIIVCGTWQMQELVSKVARDHPNQKFIIYDTSVDYDGDSAGAYKNVYSMEYKQNEGSFLAGVLGAGMSTSGVLGFVGGMDNTVIRDFLIGYIQGAKDAKPDIKVIPSYIGNFSDTAKAKELTFAQYGMGADVVFSVAANAGEGTMQASKERGRFAIGVDSDQAMIYLDSDPALAKLILSSMLKRVDQSIYLAVDQALKGTLPWGTRAMLGINEDCIGLADNPIYQSEVPADLRASINAYTDRIKAGQIKIETAFGMDEAAFNQYINDVR